jgi:hypothetical protein
MMNMVRQQEAAQRQTMQAQQAMDIEAAKEARAAALHGPALTKAQQDNILQALEIFREGVADIAEGDIAAAEAVRADIVARVPGWDKVLPPASSWDRNTRYGLMMKADKEIDKTISTPVSTLEVSVDGTPTSVTVGGLRPGQQPVYDVVEPTPMPASRATPTTPQASEPANPFAPGYKPNSAAANPNSLGLVIDSALETGVMSKSDYDKLLSIAPPESRAKIAAWVQQNNVQIMSDMSGVTDNQMRGEPVADFQTTPMAYDGQTPQSQFAVMRGEPMQSQTAGLRGAPPMEQTMAQTQPRTITKLQQKTPNVAPTPSPVPAGVIGAQEGARTSASKAVELEMNPRIAAATKNAERTIEKRSEALVAKNETKAAIQNIDKYIEEIDALLRSADRRFIVGRIEGNLHYLGSLGQNERQAELQAMFDRIKNADTLGSLVEAKQATPTGGSPVGNASNLDVQLIAKSANSLTQTGGVAKFDEDLKKLRREAYRTRQRRIEFYNDRYGDLAAEDPKFKLTVRPIADRYISSKDLPKPRKTPVNTPTKSKLSPATRAKYGL